MSVAIYWLLTRYSIATSLLLWLKLIWCRLRRRRRVKTDLASKPLRASQRPGRQWFPGRSSARPFLSGANLCRFRLRRGARLRWSEPKTGRPTQPVRGAATTPKEDLTSMNSMPPGNALVGTRSFERSSVKAWLRKPILRHAQLTDLDGACECNHSLRDARRSTFRAQDRGRVPK
jgi:hypothetical protein